MEDVGVQTLAGGTRHRDEMWLIIVYFLKQILDENHFGQLEQAEKLKRHIQKKH